MEFFKKTSIMKKEAKKTEKHAKEQARILEKLQKAKEKERIEKQNSARKIREEINKQYNTTLTKLDISTKIKTILSIYVNKNLFNDENMDKLNLVLLEANEKTKAACDILEEFIISLKANNQIEENENEDEEENEEENNEEELLDDEIVDDELSEEEVELETGE